MQTILVTGATGVGKSRLLSRLASEHNLAVIDAFVQGRNTWVEPHTYARGVAIDHIGNLVDAKAIVAAAAEWCAKHSAKLWLCDMWRGMLESQGVTIPHDAVELHLDRGVWAWPVTVAPGIRISAPVEKALTIANGLVFGDRYV